MIGFVRKLVTSCAVDGGLPAATHGAHASASHMTAAEDKASDDEGEGRKMVSREEWQDSVEA